jgi:hypothetical protein
MRTFEDMVEPRANQAGETGEADDQEAFVFFVSSGNAGELRAAAIEVGLQNVCSHEQSGGNHEPKRGDG